MEELLALASKEAEQAEVFVYEHEETPVAFETNRLKLLQTRRTRGTALRLIKNGRIGLASTTRPIEPRKMVEMALDLAQFGAEARFDLPGPQPYPKVETFDPRLAAISTDDMIRIGQSLIDAVLSHTPQVLCEATIAKESTWIHVQNSAGGDVSYRETEFSLALEGTLIRGTDMLFVGDMASSCQSIDNYLDLARETIRQLELAKEIATVRTGTLPVVFTPTGVQSALLAPLLLAFNGRAVLQGASPLVGRVGQEFFHPTLCLWDDATVPWRPSSGVCDDEGTPRQRTTLIQNGVVGQFLYDLQTAGLAGAVSTGNASRSLETLPAPAASGLLIQEGDTSLDEIIAGMKEGLVVEHLMGASQGNVLGGEFSGNVLLGYKVENGRLVGRVKDTMVSGNVYEALRDIVALSREARWVGSLRSPAICCAGLAVSAKS